MYFGKSDWTRVVLEASSFFFPPNVAKEVNLDLRVEQKCSTQRFLKRLHCLTSHAWITGFQPCFQFPPKWEKQELKSRNKSANYLKGRVGIFLCMCLWFRRSVLLASWHVVCAQADTNNTPSSPFMFFFLFLTASLSLNCCSKLLGTCFKMRPPAAH